MFSASEILSLLETVEILTWRQVFTPKINITNLTGPAGVLDQLLPSNPMLRLVKSRISGRGISIYLPKWSPFLPPQNYVPVASTPSDHRTGGTENSFQ